ncbi:protein ABHD18-like [Saccoglossus kowalevskii]|uniref:Uncharacterized protein C4orf29 homolog n=1 Tax=Saccoglossus kowalevskii TaxID=10224 RepID=A0ABM0GQK8_SACKO|nr:PREDICTED: uncharacterized protein C4orf29 homolog [Saccoglossus kowalevskii]
MSKLDVLYRSLVLSKFFTRGWGKPESLKRIFEFQKVVGSRETCQHLVDKDYPIYVDKDETRGECRIVEGHFLSPLQVHLPGIMPKEGEIAKFQFILPKTWKTRHKPVCIHLAGTGDHYFWRRRTMMARPLLKEYGIASLLLENPYYGTRKPKDQLRSSLHNVSDLFVMGGALILESLALLHWCERQGFGPLGLTGISMGGHMASLAATNWNKPITLIPCLSGTTATPVFTRGVLSNAIPWKLLQTQYECDNVYSEEITKLIHMPGSDSFELGQKFVRNYPETVKHFRTFIKDKTTMKIRNKESSTDQGISVGKLEIEQSIEKHPEMFDITTLVESKRCAKEMAMAGGVVHDAHMTDTKHVRYDNAGANGDNSDLSDQETVKNRAKKISETVELKPKLKKGKEINTGCSSLERRYKYLNEQTTHFMRGVMEEATSLTNFSLPLDPSLVIFVSATQDAYLVPEHAPRPQDIWPGSQVRYLKCGHIHAALLKTHEFRKAINDGFSMLINKYY